MESRLLDGPSGGLARSGSIVLVPEADVVKLDMSVADGIKYIMSLGSVSPAYPSVADHPGARLAMFFRFRRDARR